MTLVREISKSIHADIFFNCRKIVLAKLIKWRGCVWGDTSSNRSSCVALGGICAKLSFRDWVETMSAKSTIRVIGNRRFYTNSVLKPELLQMKQTTSLHVQSTIYMQGCAGYVSRSWAGKEGYAGSNISHLPQAF